MDEYINKTKLVEDIRLRFCKDCEPGSGNMRCRNCEISSALREINGAPIVDVVEVKYGKWIWDDNAIDWGLGDWVCDQCYSTNENIGADNPNTSPKGFSNPYVWAGSHYCPNCGANMVG